MDERHVHWVICPICYASTATELPSIDAAIAAWNRRRGETADGVALVPARIAMKLCRAIGEHDRMMQNESVRELAAWLDKNGHDQLAQYALAQIGAIPTFSPMGGEP